MNPDPGVGMWLYMAVLFAIPGFVFNVELCQVLAGVCVFGYAVDKVAG